MYNILMDIEVAHKLTALTKAFYAIEAESFSSTRQHPWDGWEAVTSRLQRMIDAGSLAEEGRIRILDIGAGNLRFEKHLRQKLDDIELEIVAVDSCPGLIDSPDGFSLEFLNLDIASGLERGTLGDAFPNAQFDLAVAFGIMHHIPVPEWREGLASVLRESLQDTGIAAISFWQFERSQRISRLATVATAKAESELGLSLDASKGDFLLGWQNKPGIYRYCHNFTDREIDGLIESGRYNVLNDYCSERDYLNRYVIFNGDID